jgi:hypothetical protein
MAMAVGLMLAGCASKPLYYWGDYQDQMYEHFKGDNSSAEEQLRHLEAQEQAARAAGAALPPGFHAHVAVIYLRLGRTDAARAQLQAEKASFPESAQYMDFLIGKLSPPTT